MGCIEEPKYALESALWLIQPLFPYASTQHVSLVGSLRALESGTRLVLLTSATVSCCEAV